MNRTSCYRLSPRAAIRSERFGGLLYHHDKRRLYFLHSQHMVDFISALDGSCALAQAVDDFLIAHGLPESNRESFIKAIGQLIKLGLVEEAIDAANV